MKKATSSNLGRCPSLELMNKQERKAGIDFFGKSLREEGLFSN